MVLQTSARADRPEDTGTAGDGEQVRSGYFPHYAGYRPATVKLFDFFEKSQTGSATFRSGESHNQAS